jgi:GrpB-like predicted nucleotidyltransferase (UPF0157 family)
MLPSEALVLRIPASCQPRHRPGHGARGGERIITRRRRRHDVGATNQPIANYHGTAVVELVPHDASWKDLYEEAAAELEDALGPIALEIHHVGSTAVPGILAKPVIDVLILVEGYDPQHRYLRPLGSLGYTFDHRDEDHVFLTGSHQGTAIHLHVIDEDADRARAMIAFRDLLRANPEDVERYQALKTELARKYSDVDEYAAAKADFINTAVRSARGSRRGTRGARRQS